MRRLLLTGITLAALGLAATASAQVAIGTLDVTMTVEATCSVTTTPIAFGIVPIDGPAPLATGTVNVTCSTGVPYSVAMDSGLHEGGTGSRRMSDGLATPNYITYRINLPDNSGQWGDPSFDNTFPAGSEWADTGSNAVKSANAFGAVTQAPTYIAGGYSDQVVVSVHL